MADPLDAKARALLDAAADLIDAHQRGGQLPGLSPLNRAESDAYDAHLQRANQLVARMTVKERRALLACLPRGSGGAVMDALLIAADRDPKNDAAVIRAAGFARKLARLRATHGSEAFKAYVRFTEWLAGDEAHNLCQASPAIAQIIAQMHLAMLSQVDAAFDPTQAHRFFAPIGTVGAASDFLNMVQEVRSARAASARKARSKDRDAARKKALQEFDRIRAEQPELSDTAICDLIAPQQDERANTIRAWVSARRRQRLAVAGK